MESGLAKFSDDADTDVESQIIPEYNEAETDADDDDDDDDADDQGWQLWTSWPCILVFANIEKLDGTRWVRSIIKFCTVHSL